MPRFEQIPECALCSKIFKTAKECYVHMLLSTSKCCQTTITNFKENGCAEDLKTLGVLAQTLFIFNKKYLFEYLTWCSWGSSIKSFVIK